MRDIKNLSIIDSFTLSYNNTNVCETNLVRCVKVFSHDGRLVL